MERAEAYLITYPRISISIFFIFSNFMSSFCLFLHFYLSSAISCLRFDSFRVKLLRIELSVSFGTRRERDYCNFYLYFGLSQLLPKLIREIGTRQEIVNFSFCPGSIDSCLVSSRMILEFR